MEQDFKEFVLHKFYVEKDNLTKETIDDADLQVYTIQRARKLNSNIFNTSKPLI